MTVAVEVVVHQHPVLQVGQVGFPVLVTVGVMGHLTFLQPIVVVVNFVSVHSLGAMHLICGHVGTFFNQLESWLGST